MEGKNLSDRELLLLIASKVEHMEEDVSSIKEDLSYLKENQSNINDTLYGDDKRQITGIVSKVKKVEGTLEKYRKWEFGLWLVGSIIFGIVTILGIERIVKIFE